ncbi:XRE family transcriptional regulator [Aeromonas veronii]|uniref:XRE family transcriptional regulator n=1 Tax=Aeromonas veronii TaxID=654 RepID=A0A3A9IMB4_AERVE|nr:helix-turn-helix transcriptional regulator [Aeromonas veronii]RKJ89938.1 XRE family transcriptional regulator [Aeromonas veronii]
MSIPQGEKLRLIRESERLNRREVTDLTGINYASYLGYENDKAKMPLEAGAKLFKVERFRKYRDWFMFDEVSPEAGQIAPALAHAGQDETACSASGKKTG